MTEAATLCQVQLAPSIDLARETSGQLYGCSFENPRSVVKGVPVVPEVQNCYCIFHHHCIQASRRSRKDGSLCPTCQRDLNTPLG